MSDTPFQDALEALPKNEIKLEGVVSSKTGGELALTLERERENLAGGFMGSISQRQGWKAAGFIKWMWK